MGYGFRQVEVRGLGLVSGHGFSRALIRFEVIGPQVKPTTPVFL